jgi:amidase
VADVALLLSAVAGPDERCPLSLPQAGGTFAPPLEPIVAGARIAWSPDAGGLPVEPPVREALAQVPAVLEGLGCEIVDAFPDLSDAPDVFSTLRAVGFELSLGRLYDERGDQLKATIRWNIEVARRRTAADVARAMRAHAEIVERLRRFMTRVDAIALPVCQVTPFDIDVEWPREVAGVEMQSYIEWMRSCSDITVTGCPAISVPAGFTPDGLPVGLQLVGRHGADLALLRLAHAFEQATRTGERRPVATS